MDRLKVVGYYFDTQEDAGILRTRSHLEFIMEIFERNSSDGPAVPVRLSSHLSSLPGFLHVSTRYRLQLRRMPYGPCV